MDKIIEWFTCYLDAWTAFIDYDTCGMITMMLLAFMFIMAFFGCLWSVIMFETEDYLHTLQNTMEDRV